MKFRPSGLVAAMAVSVASVCAQTAAPKISDHVKEDIMRHRAMASAHEAAVRCLEAGMPEEQCLKDLQAACKGLAIGKYCGMKHEH
jgi:hypothetical protein